jgi:hypothetical protein
VTCNSCSSVSQVYSSCINAVYGMSRQHTGKQVDTLCGGADPFDPRALAYARWTSSVWILVIIQEVSRTATML